MPLIDTPDPALPHHALPGDVLHFSEGYEDASEGIEMPAGYYVLCEQFQGDRLTLTRAGERDDLGPWAEPDTAEEMDALVQEAKDAGIELISDWSQSWHVPAALLWNPTVKATGLRALVL